MMTENYLFSYDQLKVLLLGCGYSKIVGLNLGNSDLNGETALDALNQLSNSKMIVSDGNRFLASKEAKLISKRLGMSDVYIAVHTTKETLPDLCCYPDENILICSSESGYKNRIAVRVSCFEDFFTDLCDEGYLPDDCENIELDDEELESFEVPLFVNYNTNYPITPDLPILFSAELISPNGTSKGYLRVIEYYFYNYILFFSEGKIERKLCVRNQLKKYLKRLMNQK